MSFILTSLFLTSISRDQQKRIKAETSEFKLSIYTHTKIEQNRYILSPFKTIPVRKLSQKSKFLHPIHLSIFAAIQFAFIQRHLQAPYQIGRWGFYNRISNISQRRYLSVDLSEIRSTSRRNPRVFFALTRFWC